MIASRILVELEKAKELSVVSVVDFVSAILLDAFAARASDIHLEPYAQYVRIRFRVDGLLSDAALFSRKILPEVVSRIKILSLLRTDEHKLPQDGRFQYTSEHITFDVRVSAVPTRYGESIVMRLLTNTLGDHRLPDLGFLPEDEHVIREALKRQSGMILVTGPTGSGKTSTLYALLMLLNQSDRSIVTIEDPVEYDLPGIKQIQAHARVGLTFAHGLRAVLRQDPDIVMVGEIRDGETAHIAVHAALTGHVLLSTLHTIDAASTIPRLLDLGAESFLVASTVRLVIAQRLVRKVCLGCKTSRAATTEEKELFSRIFGCAPGAVWRGVGCEQCSGSGYSGRVVVSEILIVDDVIRDLIASRAPAAAIKEAAIARSMITLPRDGMRKVELGLTTPEEIIRCLYE